MKHKVIPFILTGIGILTAFNAGAKDVYVYTPAGAVLKSATEIKRIEFNNGNMILVPQKGENVDIDLAQLGYFAFKPIDSDGVSSIEYADATVKLVGDVLYVTSTSEITEIRIYNALGEKTGHCAPAACTATMTVNPGGLNIVVVETGGISKPYKIAR